MMIWKMITDGLERWLCNRLTNDTYLSTTKEWKKIGKINIQIHLKNLKKGRHCSVIDWLEVWRTFAWSIRKIKNHWHRTKESLGLNRIAEMFRCQPSRGQQKYTQKRWSIIVERRQERRKRQNELPAHQKIVILWGSNGCCSATANARGCRWGVWRLFFCAMARIAIHACARAFCLLHPVGCLHNQNDGVVHSVLDRRSKGCPWHILYQTTVASEYCQESATHGRQTFPLFCKKHHHRGHDVELGRLKCRFYAPANWKGYNVSDEDSWCISNFIPFSFAYLRYYLVLLCCWNGICCCFCNSVLLLHVVIIPIGCSHYY